MRYPRWWPPNKCNYFSSGFGGCHLWILNTVKSCKSLSHFLSKMSDNLFSLILSQPSYRQVFWGRGCNLVSTSPIIQSLTKMRNEITTAVGNISVILGSRNPMELVGIRYDRFGNGKSKMSAFLEIPLCQPSKRYKNSLTAQLMYVLGPAIPWNWWDHRCMKTISNYSPWQNWPLKNTGFLGSISK